MATRTDRNSGTFASTDAIVHLTSIPLNFQTVAYSKSARVDDHVRARRAQDAANRRLARWASRNTEREQSNTIAKQINRDSMAFTDQNEKNLEKSTSACTALDSVDLFPETCSIAVNDDQSTDLKASCVESFSRLGSQNASMTTLESHSVAAAFRQGAFRIDHPKSTSNPRICSPLYLQCFTLMQTGEDLKDAHTRPETASPSRANGASQEHPSASWTGKASVSDTEADQRIDRRHKSTSSSYDLRNRRHIDIEKGKSMTFNRTHRRAPIARDWHTKKKRFVAVVQCLNTALVGAIVGIYAGEVPALQYQVVDEGHITILGNVLFFVGMAIPMLFLYTLPILHGRKPYTLGSLAILLPLMFPQALAVQNQRGTTTPDYRVLLIAPRAFAGIAAGFIEMNLMTTLLDLFGASLQSSNPHQEIPDPNDVRRHGGGMGVWLGIWTWCAIGSIGLGFLLGACIISAFNPAWGFWVSIFLCAAVLVLNVIAPETRRSPYRRSMAEVRTGSEVFRRFAKGEFMMHLYQVGPVHWWEEMLAGWMLVIKMLAQPGFLMLALYQGWVYAEVVMLIIVLGNLASVEYQLHPALVGACALSIPVGAALAIPFQKASLLSRSRKAPPRTDSMTFEKRVTWSSHLVRRAVFMITLPLCTMAYTISSVGNRVTIAVPLLFAAGVGFVSNLALSEVFGILMETFDTSDLQPGMTGRLRRIVPDSMKGKRTNFSCFPRVTAAFMIVQAIAFLISAAATGAGGSITHRVGAQKATGIMCGILFGLSILLILTLTRFRTVQVVPKQKYATGELSGPEDEWKPVIIGHPSGTTRRVSLLELGNMTRWTEIRRKNRVYNTPPVSGNGSRRLNRGADRAGD